MSYEIILITGQDLKFPDYGIDFRNSENDKFLNIFQDESVKTYYDQREIEMIESCLGNSIFFYLIDTNSLDSLKSVLRKIPQDINLLVDNDHGSISKRDAVFSCRNFSELFKLKQAKL